MSNTDHLTPEQIARETVTLRLKLHKLGLRKKIATDQVAPDVDQDLVHVGKDILDKSATEIKALNAHDSQAKTWIKARSIENPILAGGTYLIPFRLVPDIRAFVDNYIAERSNLVDQFCWRYDELKADARDRLEPQGIYDPDDYPDVDEVRAAFWVEWGFDASINLPEAMREHQSQVYREIYEQEKARAEGQWRNATEEIRTALREAFAKLVNHMAEQLTPDPKTGKPRKIYDSMLEHIGAFLDTFEARDLTRDGDLALITARAREILIGVTTSGLREDSTMREHVGAAFEQIQTSLDGMITTAPTRRIKIERQDPAPESGPAPIMPESTFEAAGAA